MRAIEVLKEVVNRAKKEGARNDTHTLIRVDSLPGVTWYIKLEDVEEVIMVLNAITPTPHRCDDPIVAPPGLKTILKFHYDSENYNPEYAYHYIESQGVKIKANFCPYCGEALD